MMSTRPLPAGAITDSSVSLTMVNAACGEPSLAPNWTRCVVVKPLPVTVTVSPPPLSEAALGATEATVGALPPPPPGGPCAGS